jgi:cbb3-type cytochrome oxidase subunit 3
VKLSDVVGNSGLAIYAEIALILFLVAFVGIVAWLLWPGRRGQLEPLGRMPLEDESRPTNPGDPS